MCILCNAVNGGHLVRSFEWHMCVVQLVPMGLTLLFTMTEREADNFGIFFRELLRCIQGWWVSLHVAFAQTVHCVF